MSSEPVVRKAEPKDFPEIRYLFDTHSSGIYGFVPHARIKTEMNRGGVWVVEIKGEIVAAAIGKEDGTLWNLMVDPVHRHKHLGSLLIAAVQPEKIRVKCRPHKSMTESERKRFVDPTRFYEKLGYVFESWDYPRQVFLSPAAGAFKGRVVGKGESRSIKIMRKPHSNETPGDRDSTSGPRVKSARSMIKSQRPKIRST